LLTRRNPAAKRIAPSWGCSRDQRQRHERGGASPAPSAAYVEREGIFTNFQGRVQRLRTALGPLGEAMADWQSLGRLGRALGGADPVFAATRPEQVFAGLSGQIPAFSGMTYHGLGDAGLMMKG
jgi:predicted molibdopterin-dependent oxidoreductase YjgC